MQRIAQGRKLFVPPMLSVVIPLTRMAGKLSNLRTNLSRCKGLDIEVILVHDEQDDKTQRELEELLLEISLSNYKLIRQSVYSPGLARNLGISEASGSWITFWDVDDLVEPQGYFRLISKAKAREASVGIGQIQTSSLKDLYFQPRNFHFSDSFNELIYDLAYLPAFTRFIFQRETFKNLRFPEFLLGEDLVFLAGLNFLDFKLEVSEEILYTYIIHQDSQAISRKDLNIELVKARNYLINNFKERSPLMKKYLITQILRINFSLISRHLNLLQSILITTIFLIREPYLTLKSCHALLRRRSEFQVR